MKTEFSAVYNLYGHCTLCGSKGQAIFGIFLRKNTNILLFKIKG